MCRLLAMGSGHTSEVDCTPVNALRLAARLYTAQLRRAFGIYTTLSKIHVEKLKEIMQCTQTDWTNLELLKLWIIAVGAMESIPIGHEEYFREELHIQSEKLGFTTVADTAKYLLYAQSCGSKSWTRRVFWRAYVVDAARVLANGRCLPKAVLFMQIPTPFSKNS